MLSSAGLAPETGGKLGNAGVVGALAAASCKLATVVCCPFNCSANSSLRRLSCSISCRAFSLPRCIACNAASALAVHNSSSLIFRAAASTCCTVPTCVGVASALGWSSASHIKKINSANTADPPPNNNSFCFLAVLAASGTLLMVSPRARCRRR